MATIEAFEAALKDVLKAKRLSQSKMAALTKVALDCMDNDVQMVSSLYRTHRGLSPDAKGASLYAFDALARAARNRVVKNNLIADLSADKGNCATFLLRIEGVLDGLFRDLASTDSGNLKEKAKKILDIWTKQNTFSSAVLSPLYSVLEQAGKDKEPNNAETTNVVSTEPVPPALPPADPTAQAPIQPVDVTAVQSTLFALLSKAASAVNAAAPMTTQTAPNFVPPPAAPVPILDANQLALLHQLAQTAKGNAVPSQPIPVPASVVPSLTTPNGVLVVPPVQGPPQPQPFPYRDDHYGAPASAPHRESEHVRSDGPERGYPRDDYNDPRRGSRGGPRERRRGGRGRGRWDDRDRDHFRDRSREFSRDPRPRRSRSGSPPGRYGGPGPRYARPYSPPPPPGRRGGYGQRQPQGYGPGAAAQVSGRGEPEAGKDEFGRDLRPESPRADSDTASVQAHQQRSASPLPPGTGSVTTSDRGSVASENAHPAAPRAAAPYSQPYPDAPPHAHSYPAGSPVSPPISPSTSTAPPLSPVQHHRVPGAGGALEGFDRASFDPSDPASWETLGKAWTATHATMPTQQELMQFIMGGAGPPVPQQAPGTYGAPPPQQQQQHQRFQSPPSSQPPPPQQHSQPYDDGGGRQWQGPDRQQWNNRSQDPRGGGWRGGPGGRGGGRDDFGGAGRARARGRGDFGRGGYGRGEPGRRGFGREDHGRGDYGGYGNGRGAYSAGGGGHHEQDTDAVMLGGGDDHSWQHEQSPSYGLLPPQAYQEQLYRDPPPPVPVQPPFQAQAQGPPPYGAPPPPSHEVEGGGGGGGLGGRMQKVGDKWVFVRSAA
ncbi:hypothetical protein VTO73DRAFT_7477 [Trametes versicolor]